MAGLEILVHKRVLQVGSLFCQANTLYSLTRIQSAETVFIIIKMGTILKMS